MTSPACALALREGLLGALSVEEFLARHWQRRPLLVRGAVAAPVAGIDWPAMRALARRDDVQSRIVRRRGERWALANGPFEDDEIPALERRQWTILVQGVDLHLDAARDLVDRFRFLPDVRIDDLMISTAGDGGGVGPHVDSYDVFLVQLQGRRRWRIAPPGDPSLRDGLPLKILRTFVPTHEHVLDAGDMLYLPAGWGHDGVAIGPCMTGSVGFRAPSRSEFLRALFEDCLDDPDAFGAQTSAIGHDGNPPGARRPGRPADPRYRDDARRLRPSTPAAIPADLRTALAGWASGWRFSHAHVERFIGRFLTEPKPDVWFDPPGRPLTRAAFQTRLQRGGVRLDRRTRLAYRGADCFANGEHFRPAPRARRLVARLADRRWIGPADDLGEPPSELIDLIYAWYRHGWLVLIDRAPRGRVSRVA